jgi:hypothetical protein
MCVPLKLYQHALWLIDVLIWYRRGVHAEILVLIILVQLDWHDGFYKVANYVDPLWGVRYSYEMVYYIMRPRGLAKTFKLEILSR